MLAIGPLAGLAIFIFRFCTGNHPLSLRCRQRKHKVRYWRPLRVDSPRGGELSRSERGDGALFALSPTVTEGWFPATNLTPVGWFPTQGLKINRTTATYAQKIYSPITHHRGRAKPGPPPVYEGLSLYTLLVNCKIVLPCGGRIRRGFSFSGSAARQHRPQPAAHQCR